MDSTLKFMHPSAPDGGPSWLPWILFVLAAIAWLAREVSHNRTDNAARESAQLEALKSRLEILDVATSTYERQLNAIRDALQADAVPVTNAQVAALEGTERSNDRAIAEHLRSRESARKALPVVLARLVAARARQTEMERDIAAGITPAGSDVSSLRTDLDRIAVQLTEVIEQLAKAPRIYLSELPPDEPRDGDIWLRH